MIVTNVDFKSKIAFRGTGAKLIFEFIREFQGEFCRKTEVYARHRIDDNDFEHLFYYGEQQTKTYVTAALDKICNGNFIQESHVKRCNHQSRASELLSNGRVDYWCRYGVGTKFCVLMEFKQSWIRYYSKDKWTVFRGAINKHKHAVSQIKSIKNKTDYTYDNLYVLALTLLPLYIQYRPPNTDSLMTIDQSTIKEVAENAVIKTGADGYGTYIIKKESCPIILVDKEKQIYENYPGIIFLWSMKKVTKA